MLEAQRAQLRAMVRRRGGAVRANFRPENLRGNAAAEAAAADELDAATLARVRRGL